MSKTFLCLILLCFSLRIVSAEEADTLKKKQLFEFSFGQSLLFISNSKLVDIRNEAAIVLPTSSALFFIELRPHKKLRIPVFFNLPTESKQFIVNNVLVNEKANPTLGTGLQYKLFKIKLDAKSKIEFEAGPLVSFITRVNKEIVVAPLVAGRFRITRGENFVMYVGNSYSFGINTLGLIFGTGTVF